MYHSSEGSLRPIVINFLNKPRDEVTYGLVSFPTKEAEDKLMASGKNGVLKSGSKSLVKFELSVLTGHDLYRLDMAGYWTHIHKDDILRVRFNNQIDLFKILKIWGSRTPDPEAKDVHTEHCCIKHGCKYGDNNCTVENRHKPQSYLCEMCR
jgi:hypothetical protein